MKINNTNLFFEGVWRKSTKMSNSPKEFGANNVYYEIISYHPFQDEEVSDEIKAKETLKGTEYFEYDNHNFGHGVESSLAVQEVKLGERLDITKAQYDELIAIQQAGLDATKKLNSLGSIDMYSNGLPTNKGHNTTFDENPIDDKQIKHIIETI